MPAEFQQTVDKTLNGAQGACAFIDDIIICLKGTPADHMREVNRVLCRLEAANLALKLSKCQFMLSEVDWLGFCLTQTGIVPLRHKLDGLFNLQQPKTLKQVRGLMGSAHQLPKFFASPSVHSLKRANALSGTTFTHLLSRVQKNHSSPIAKTPTLRPAPPRVSRVTLVILDSAPFSSSNSLAGGSLLRTRLVSSMMPSHVTARTNSNSSRSFGVLNISAIMFSVTTSPFAGITVPSSVL